MAVTNTRHVRIRPDEADEIAVPRDVANVLGTEAEIQVEPGQVTIRRSGKLTAEYLSSIAKPPKTAEELMRHAKTPLTDAERASLNEFLNG